MQITRQYHSTTLLLPDGRVLSSGGGICGTCDQVGYLAKNAEIFSPPYLFDADGTLAARPAIDAAPTATSYGAAMEIATANPASISKVALVRLGAVTHSVNMEQRYIPLSFTAGATSITATAPANANVAPPGPYMLFIIDANGVPSVARMVSVQGGLAAGRRADAADGRRDLHRAGHRESRGDASDADGSVSKVEFFNGAAKLGEDTTAPYGFTWSGVAAGTYTLTARATDNLGATTTSAASTITVNADTQPTCPQGQYLAEYFANQTLSGPPAFTRCELAIANNWGSGGPGNGLGNDGFSVRWTGKFDFAADVYSFTARADDGVRLWVDGQQLIDGWVDQAATTYQANKTLATGEHEVKLEYYENGGDAVAELGWVSANDHDPPSAPSAPSATAVSAGQINLAWTASTDNVAVTGYRVERCQGAGCTDFVQVATPSETFYNDTDLTAATSYSYRVRATDAADNLSGYSTSRARPHRRPESARAPRLSG